MWYIDVAILRLALHLRANLGNPSTRNRPERQTARHATRNNQQRDTYQADNLKPTATTRILPPYLPRIYGGLEGLINEDKEKRYKMQPNQTLFAIPRAGSDR
jgi:hypothetical protein